MFLMNRKQTLIFNIIPRVLNIYQVKKTGGVSIREGASIRINTVHGLTLILRFILQWERPPISQS